jgi:hypothetical protein
MFSISIVSEVTARRGSEGCGNPPGPGFVSIYSRWISAINAAGFPA